MASAIDRLRARAAANKAQEGQTQPAPEKGQTQPAPEKGQTQSAPEKGDPAPDIPSQAEIDAQDRASSPVKDTTAERAPGAGAEGEFEIRELAPLVHSDDEAKNALATLMGGELSEDVDMASVAASVDGGVGMSFALPFASLRSGNWDVARSIPDDIFRFMPAGDRAWTGVYLCHRVGATGWRGAGSAGKGGEPPIWRFALPHPRVEPVALELIRQTMKVGNKIQFTKSEDRVKFDDVGRLTPEVHILVWSPETGFIILVGTGYKTAQNTLARMKEVEAQHPMVPVRFTVEEEEQKNKRVMREDPGAKNAQWVDHYVNGAVDTTDNGRRIAQAFTELQARDVQSIANAAMHFMKADDFDGLSLDEVAEKLDAYASNGLVTF